MISLHYSVSIQLRLAVNLPCNRLSSLIYQVLTEDRSMTHEQLATFAENESGDILQSKSQPRIKWIRSVPSNRQSNVTAGSPRPREPMGRVWRLCCCCCCWDVTQVHREPAGLMWLDALVFTSCVCISRRFSLARWSRQKAGEQLLFCFQLESSDIFKCSLCNQLPLSLAFSLCVPLFTTSFGNLVRPFAELESADVLHVAFLASNYVK